MDEMKLRKGVITKLIERFLRKMIKKKFNVDVKLSIDELDFISNDDKTTIHFNGDATINKDQLNLLIGDIEL